LKIHENIVRIRSSKNNFDGWSRGLQKQYLIRNWSEYNKALVNRGSLTIWFDEESVSEWHNVQLTGPGIFATKPSNLHRLRPVFSTIDLFPFDSRLSRHS
jgi:hypothetical protein